MDDKFKEELIEQYQTAHAEYKRLGGLLAKEVPICDTSLNWCMEYMKNSGKVEALKWVAEQLGIPLPEEEKAE